MKTTEKYQLKAYVTKEMFDKFTEKAKEEERSISSLLSYLIKKEINNNG